MEDEVAYLRTQGSPTVVRARRKGFWQLRQAFRVANYKRAQWMLSDEEYATEAAAIANRG